MLRFIEALHGIMQAGPGGATAHPVSFGENIYQIGKSARREFGRFGGNGRKLNE